MLNLFRPRSAFPSYAVTLALSGQHPYRDEPEFQLEDGTATIHVSAKSWSDAARQATKLDVLNRLKFWSARVVKIELE